MAIVGAPAAELCEMAAIGSIFRMPWVCFGFATISSEPLSEWGGVIVPPRGLGVAAVAGVVDAMVLVISRVQVVGRQSSEAQSFLCYF